MMKISELSQTTGVSSRSIRHYEKKNLIASRRLKNGYRDFDESTIELIKSIQIYLNLGLNTDQIHEIIHCKVNYPSDDMKEFCNETLETYEATLDEINRKMEMLSSVKQRLQKHIAYQKERSTNMDQ